MTQERSAERYKARYAKLIECLKGHYETEKVPFGRVYRWCAQRVVVECECGERVNLASSMSTCAGCGTDHAELVREWLPAEHREEEVVEDEVIRPWRKVRDYEGEVLPC